MTEPKVAGRTHRTRHTIDGGGERDGERGGPFDPRMKTHDLAQIELAHRARQSELTGNRSCIDTLAIERDELSSLRTFSVSFTIDDDDGHLVVGKQFPLDRVGKG